MAILSYQSEEPLNREAMAISFDVPDDMNIGEFKIMCIRMASSMGYQTLSINSSSVRTPLIINSSIKVSMIISKVAILCSSIVSIMEILYIILGISVLLNIFLIFRGVKLVKQVEQQQAISANKVKTGLLSLESMLSEMQEMDIKGAFDP